MPSHFLRARPLQAAKLAAIVVVLPYSAGVIFGLVPVESITSLIVVPFLAIGLVVAVAAETLLAGVRALRADGRLADRLASRPFYTLVRAVEVLAAVVSVGAVAYIVASIPEGPMAGPGALWLWFVVVGLAGLVLVGSLVRTLAEYYHHRRRLAA